MQEIKINEKDFADINQRLEILGDENNGIQVNTGTSNEKKQVEVQEGKKIIKEEWLQKEFKLEKTDVLMDSCSAALLRTVLVQGRIYVTSNYLVFYSNIFGYVTKKKWSLPGIENVRKRRGRLVANSIKVIFSDPSTIPVVFASLSNRDRILNTISFCLRKQQTQQLSTRRVTYNVFEEKSRLSILRERNIVEEYSIVDEFQKDSDTKEKSLIDKQSSNQTPTHGILSYITDNENCSTNRKENDSKYQSPQNVILQSSQLKDFSLEVQQSPYASDHVQNEENMLEIEPLSNVTAPETELKNTSSLQMNTEEEPPKDLNESNGTATDTNSKIITFQDTNIKQVTLQEPKTSDVTVSECTESNMESDEKDSSSKHVRSKSSLEIEEALKSMVWHRLGDPMDTIFGKKYMNKTVQAKDVLKYPPIFVFNNLFINPWIVTYLTDTNNSNIKASDWYETEKSGSFQRDVSYIRPLSHRMGPRQTRVLETQRYCFKSDGGVLIESEARNLDVPYGDNFRVESFFELYSAEGGKKTEFTASIAINFIKGTMLRGVIESATMSETKILFEKLIEMGKNELESSVQKSHVNAFLRKQRKPSLIEQLFDMIKIY